jgi:PAS domain S-box-containing protein
VSFRLKTILGIALIETILLLILILSSLSYLRESNTEEVENRAHALAKLFATTAKDAVIANDLATLDAFIDEAIQNEGLSYIRFTGREDLVLAQSGDPEHLARTFVTDPSIEAVDDHIFDVSASIEESGYTFGRVELGVSTQKLEQVMAEAKQKFYVIAAIEIVLVALFSFLLGTYLTRQLARLENGARRITDGEMGYQVEVDGKDELASTVNTFNIMSRRLKQFYNEIENDQRRLEAVMDTVIDGVVTIDDMGIMLSVNSGVLEIFGYEESELIGRNVSILMPSPHREQHDSYIQDYIHGGEAKVIGLRRELVGIKKSGVQFPLELAVSDLEFDGELMFVGVMRDLTQIKEINRELNKSKILNAEILQSALDSIVTLSMDGRVIAFNPSAEKLFGYSASEIEGKNFADYLSTSNKDLFSADPETANQVLGETIELSAINRAGGKVPIEMAITKIRVGDESFVNTFIRDISARKQAEAMMILAKEQAESASKAKSEFLALMSHEIRTPMNAILGSLSILEQEGLTPDQKKYIRMANDAGKSLLWLINDILDFSKIEAGKLELDESTFDVVPLVEETLDLLQTRAKENSIELVSWFDYGLPVRMTCDQGKLRQILINFISNAVKFTHDGGIVVCCRPYDENTVQFEVIDTGIGIAKETLPKLFEQFTQADSSAKRKYGGSGLGLAISKRLAHLMRGEVGAISEPEVGSQFWLRLPHNMTQPVLLRDTYKSFDATVRVHENNEIARCALIRQIEQMGVDVEIDFSDTKTSWIEIETEDLSRKYEILGYAEKSEAGQDALSKPLYLKTVYAALGQRGHGYEYDGNDRRTIDRESLKGKRLLLAEDSQANQIIARTMLENAGYEVYAVSNGKEAVEAVKNFSFDLVLMDISMPEMDGIEATRAIRRLQGKSGQQQIIALTANVFKDDIDRCLEVGMQGFVSKPIEKRKLLKSIAEHLVDETPEIALQEQAERKDDACVDVSTLKHLIDDVGEEVVPTMLDIYVQETRDRLKRIEQAANEEDFSNLRSEAHALKSSSGALGAILLQDRAFQVELACKESRSMDAIDNARALPGIADRCLDELANYMKQD